MTEQSNGILLWILLGVGIFLRFTSIHIIRGGIKMRKRTRKVTIAILEFNDDDSNFIKFFNFEESHKYKGRRFFKSGDGKNVLSVEITKVADLKFYRGVFYKSSQIINSYYFDEVRYVDSDVNDRVQDNEHVVNAFRFLIIPHDGKEYFVFEDVRTPTKNDFRDLIIEYYLQNKISENLILNIKDAPRGYFPNLSEVDVRKVTIKKYGGTHGDKKFSDSLQVDTVTETEIKPQPRKAGVDVRLDRGGPEGNKLYITDGRNRSEIQEIIIDECDEVFLVYKIGKEKHIYNLKNQKITDYLEIDENSISDHQAIWNILYSQYKTYF